MNLNIYEAKHSSCDWNAIYNICKRSDLAIALVILFMVFTPIEVFAQTGTVIGEIIDAESGETLPGATVTVQGTYIGTSADVDGRYTLRRVPVGEQILEYRSLGYTSELISVTISEDERIVLNIALTGESIMGDDIIVVARQRGQARSLTKQRQSVNIRSVVSSEQMEAFGDQTVSESLSRVAGMGHGSGNIRGVGAGASNITMDGQRMGTTGGDRSVDLETISADMVQELEIIKVITPDMNADALAGVINISTRRPVGGDKSVNARLGGGWNSRFIGNTGPYSRASFSYGESPSDVFSYAVNLSYQKSSNASESVSTDWGIGNFGDGPKDIISGMRTQLELDPRQRYGTGLQFTYQPSERITYHIQGMFNYQTREQTRHGMSIHPDLRDFINPNATRSMGSSHGSIGYNTRLDHYDINQYTIQAGGRHLYEKFDMDYKLGWGHGRLIHDQYTFDFRTDGRYDFLMFFDNRWSPIIEVAPYGTRANFPGPNLFNSRGVDNRLVTHVDNEFTATIDFEIPHSRGFFKLGSNANLTFKNGDQERLNMATDQRYTIEDFDLALNSNWKVFDRSHQTYDIPWLIDLPKAREWYLGRHPLLIMDMENWAASSETNDFAAHEHTVAGYGMVTLAFWKMRFLGGLRVEHTDVRYDGKDSTIDETSRFRGALNVTSNNRYTNIFPNAQLVYAIGSRSNIRLAYSRSIARPTFSQLSPSTLRNYASETLNQGNPGLEPMLSNNLDFLIEYYFMDVGQFTIGLYYKALSNFVYSSIDIIGVDGLEGEGDYVGWRWSTYLNGEEATVYGLEISWQKNLSFLPGFLGNFGTYANYSYSESIADLDRRQTTRLQDQRPHVVNLGLDYSQGSFSSQISYQWAAPSISSYASEPRWVPEIQTRERVYFDSFRDAANDLSVTVRYRLTSNFWIMADATNILNYQSVSYNFNRDYYPSTASFSGRLINLSVRYSL